MCKARSLTSRTSLPTLRPLFGVAGNWAGFRIDGQPDDTHYDGFNFTGPLAGGGTQTLRNSIDTSTLSVGTHTLWIKADYWGDAVAESDENNNLTSFTFEVTAADLEVSGITPAATSVMQGAAFTFSYVIENGGTATSGASWAGFMVDHAVNPAHYIGFGQTNALAVDGTQTLTGTIDTSVSVSARTRSTWRRTTGTTWSARAIRPQCAVGDLRGDGATTGRSHGGQHHAGRGIGGEGRRLRLLVRDQE